MFSPDAGHHQANVTTMADLVAQRLLDAIPPPDLTDTTVASTLATDPTPTAMINVAHPPSRDTALLEQMQAMMTMMMASSSPRSQSGGRGRGRGRHTSRTPGRGSAQTPWQYCHTHGACAHDGASCNNHGADHKKEATFANMLDGSTAHCYWITPPT